MTAAIDLFAGAGGASLGLHRAGFVVSGYDKWPVACETHRRAGFTTVEADLNTFAWPDLPVPFLWASPPCQPFSAAGSGRGHADERDGMPALLRAVEALRPAVLVMENVKGLTFTKHRWYLDAALKRLAELGYAAEWRVLNAADYGVPQTRERLILIARCDSGPIAWPEPTHTRSPGIIGPLPWVTMAEALGWDGVVNTGSNSRVRLSLPGETWRETTVLYRVPVSRPAPTIEVKAAAWGWTHERPATTITGDSRAFGPHAGSAGESQSSNAIRVTPDEAAALQGFPPGYPFAGTRTQIAKQIGNAVPPPLAEAIGRALLPTLPR